MSRKIVRRPLETLPEDDPRATDGQGQVVSVQPTEAVVTAGWDGIPTRVSREQRHYVEHQIDLVPADPVRDLDALTALQIGGARLLQSLDCWQHDLEARLSNPADIQSRSWRLARIFFDWPKSEDDLAPYPSAVIRGQGERTYDQQGRHPILLDDTLNVFGPGTVLRKLSHVTTTILISVLFDSREERRGFLAAAERQMLVEPAQDLVGRRIVVREAYDRVARFVFEGTEYANGPREGQENVWEGALRFSADIDRVALVKAPERLRPQLSTFADSQT